MEKFNKKTLIIGLIIFIGVVLLAISTFGQTWLNPKDLNPPQNLTAEIVDYNSSIIISWDDAARSKKINRDFIGYNIYRDGEFLTFTTETSFESIGPLGGLNKKK